jgi:hypothetical protein
MYVLILSISGTELATGNVPLHPTLSPLNPTVSVTTKFLKLLTVLTSQTATVTDVL